MVEIPEAKKCCYCLPLRRGLLAWVYLKLAILVSVTFGAVTPLVLLVLFSGYLTDGLLAVTIVVVTVLTVEMIFDFLFIVSAHKKKYVYLRIYYRYEIVMLINEAFFFLFYLVYGIFDMLSERYLVHIFLGGVCIIIVLLALHMYFIYLVRSEVKKLQLTTQFNFKNFVNDPECSAQILE